VTKEEIELHLEYLASRKDKLMNQLAIVLSEQKRYESMLNKMHELENE
jgi:hypothetical protein